MLMSGTVTPGRNSSLYMGMAMYTLENFPVPGGSRGRPDSGKHLRNGIKIIVRLGRMNYCRRRFTTGRNPGGNFLSAIW